MVLGRSRLASQTSMESPVVAVEGSTQAELEARGQLRLGDIDPETGEIA